MPPTVERKLTTVLCADVEGYSRLMDRDEVGTLEILKRHRDALAGLIERHRGRVVNTWGDGLIAEFPSVVEAVLCAVEAQKELRARNAGLLAERRLEFRIGINLGDVILQAGDIFGDGVNVAARLEGLAAPGGICVSGVVHDQVQDKLAFSFEDMAEQSVKNIARPVHVYRVRLGEGRPSPPAARRPRSKRPALIGGGLVALCALAFLFFSQMRGPVAPSFGFDEAKLRAMAAQQQIALPDQLGFAPAGNAPASAAAYLGAWGAERGWGNGGRHAIVIVTAVDPAGGATVIYSEGPPGPNSYVRSPARLATVRGQIGSDGLNFAVGTTKYAFVATTNGLLLGRLVMGDGRDASNTFARIQ